MVPDWDRMGRKQGCELTLFHSRESMPLVQAQVLPCYSRLACLQGMPEMCPWGISSFHWKKEACMGLMAFCSWLAHILFPYVLLIPQVLFELPCHHGMQYSPRANQHSPILCDIAFSLPAYRPGFILATKNWHWLWFRKGEFNWGPVSIGHSGTMGAWQLVG